MRKNLFLATLCLFFVFSFVSAYTVTTYSSNSLSSSNSFLTYDANVCDFGQDFLIRIPNGGCSPSVVTSELLEEQNVPVFCEIEAYKINPAIKIVSIDSINFGSSYPKEVSTVSFLPSYSALNLDTQLTSSGWTNIGYAVIYLKQNKNESSMPKMVSGNLTATIVYKADSSYGSTNRVMYLPLMTDSAFDEKEGQYSFFDGSGYLRADNIEDNSATIGVYSGIYADSSSTTKQKVFSSKLNVGQSSSSFYLPDIGCFASSYFKLESVDSEDTRAIIEVNSESFELTKGEGFLDGNCKVLDDPEKEGLRESVKVRCSGDEGVETFTLWIEPTVVLSVNGKSNTYKVGDYLYDSGKYSIYLGYAGTVEDETDLAHSAIYLVAVPEVEVSVKADGLDDGSLSYIAKVAERQLEKDQTLSDAIKTGLGAVSDSFNWLLSGENYKKISYKNPENFLGNDVAIIGFGTGTNVEFNNATLSSYYSSAVDDYKKVESAFGSETYPESSKYVLGETSLSSLIQLADKLYQREDLKKYCDKFEEEYPDSKLLPSACEGIPDYSNDGVSSRTFLIGGQYKEISFEGIEKSNFDDYGIEINIRKGSEVLVDSLKMGKGDTVYLNSLFNSSGENEYITLEKISDDDNAVINFNLNEKSTSAKVGEFLTSSSKMLERGKSTSISGSSYTFTISKINLKKVAKVSLHTDVKDYSKAEFSFNVGIEKREIQLSDEQIKSNIEKFTALNKTLSNLAENVGNVADVFETTCKGVGTYLVLKNMLLTSGTESLARKSVMNDEGGWYEKCADLVKQNVYASSEKCLLENSGKIETQVEQMAKVMDAQDKVISSLEDVDGITTSFGLFGQDVVNTDKLTELYISDVRESLPSSVLNPDKSPETIDMNKVLNYLTAEGYEDKFFDLENLKEIALYSDLITTYPTDETYKKRLYTALYSLEQNIDNGLKITEAVKADSLSSNDVITVETSKDAKVYVYSGRTAYDFRTKTFANLLDSETPVQKIIVSDGTIYYLILEKKTATQYYILKDDMGLVVYSEDGIKRISSENIPKEFLSLSFKKYDSSSYNNEIKSPEIKYYEVDPYKGLPAVVPFDVDKGWYAYMPQSMSTSATRTYDDSGRLDSLYLCNVGENGIMEYNPIGDDEICELINLATGQPYNQFPGLEESEAESLVVKAQKAVETASNAYRSGVNQVKINGVTMEVGSPATESEIYQCADVMSITDCQILFNACDPVVCPSSRCDFGGEYPVSNVIQSGLIGSLALCLPNVNEGIYVPVCLTGVEAGLDELASYTDAYVQCLNEHLESGETVGICDETWSIYACEFVWKTALPLAKFSIPKLDNLIFGTGSKGGGEYLGGIDAAFENAQNSVEYLSQNYLSDVYATFTAKSQSEIGTDVCDNFVSVVWPDAQLALSSVSGLSDNVVKFTGSVEETSYSTTVNPPQSQYKVYYHIYPGDEGAYYKIYLKQSDSSYYQDSFSTYVLDSGYVSSGSYVDETKDFIAAEGYTKLCIRVNNDEECGFDSVSTSFALDYLKDEYIQSQAEATNITSQEDCVSGTASLYSLLGLNLQSSLEDLASPSLYAQGIVRVCATDNPGSSSDSYYGTENQRWIDVGYCGDKSVRCWIDTDSIADATIFEKTESDTLESLTETLIEKLKSQSGMLSDDDFSTALEEIENENSYWKKIEMVEKIYDKVSENNKKGYLLLLRGNSYGELAKDIFAELIRLGKITLPTEKSDGTSSSSSVATSLTYGNPLFEINGLCYRYNSTLGEWQWRENCNGFEVTSPAGASSYSTPSTYSNSLTEYEWKFLSDEATETYSSSKEIIEGLDKIKTYTAGLEFLIDQVETRDMTLKSGSVELSLDNKNMIFEILVEGEISKIYTKYFDGKWYWGFDKETWTAVPTSQTKIAYGFWDELLSQVKSFFGIETYYADYLVSIEDSSDGYALINLLNDGDPNFLTGAIMIFRGNYETYKADSVETVSIPSDCVNYYSEIKTVSEKYDVDPSLILAIMIQESSCNALASSDSSYGLMQINAGVWCGEYGLSSDKDSCKNILLSDTNTNIEVGVNILVENYGIYKNGVEFKGCNVEKTYTEWEAALRAYNGLSCNKNYPSQDQYVDEVVTKWNSIKAQGIFETVEEKTSTTDFSDEEKTWTLETVLAAAKLRTGKYSDNSNFVDELCDQEILTTDECKTIKGTNLGIYRWGQKDMTYVVGVLEEKWEKKFDINAYSNLINLENPNFDDLYERAILNNSFISILGRNGRTIMHYVAEFGSVGQLDYLVAHGGNVGVKDSLNQIPLHYAARYNTLAVVKDLVNENPEIIQLKNTDLTTPLDLALNNPTSDQLEIVTYLRKLELDLTIHGKISPFVFESFELDEHFCSRYARMLADRLFGYEYSWTDAWCRESLDKVVWSATEVSEENNNYLGELESEGKLKPGMIVGVYYPFTSTGLLGKTGLCGSTKVTIKYTHNLLYLGKNDEGKLIFAELFYSGAPPSIRSLEEFNNPNAKFVAMAVVEPN